MEIEKALEYLTPEDRNVVCSALAIRKEAEKFVAYYAKHGSQRLGNGVAFQFFIYCQETLR